MGDYGWSMDFDTYQDIVAVEYGRVLEYPKKRDKISDHEKKLWVTMGGQWILIPRKVSTQ